MLREVEADIGAIIDVQPIKHICLVGNNRARVQGIAPMNCAKE